MRADGGPAAYAERECGRCFGGVVYVGGPTKVETAPCPDCEGTGKLRAFIYPKPKGRRGPWPPEEAAERARRSADPR